MFSCSMSSSGCDFLIALSNTNIITQEANILIPISPTKESKSPDKTTPIIADGIADNRPKLAA